MLEALQILFEELPQIGTNISALVVIAIVFAITLKVSSFFESKIFRYLIAAIAIVMLLHPIHPQYHSVFFNIQNWIAFGALIPHVRFIIEDLEEKYYQLKYATINAYYFWLTVYYKLLRLTKAAIWLMVSIFNALLWSYYAIKYFVFLTAYFVGSIGKPKEHPLKKRFQIYWQWYKEDWQYQSEQREYAKYNYREWYKGTKFYYKNPNDYFDDSWVDQEREKEDGSKQEEERQKAYEEYKKQHGYSRQEESKSYQKSYQNQSEQKQYDSKYARFFSGNYYDVLGVAKNASFDEIKTAWKKLVKEYHPDLHPENQDEFTKIIQKINEAYEYFKKMNS